MKAALLVGLLACMGLLSGCNASPDVVSDAKTQEQAPSAPPSEQPSQRAKSIPPATEWRTLYRDNKKENILAYFARARELLKLQKGVDGEPDSWSKYFGPWVIIEIKTAPADDLIALDGPAPSKHAYLLDMAHETVIETGDWKAAKPFFDAQFAVILKGFSSRDDERNFWANLASSASAVAFGHTNYVDYEGQGVRYPKPVTGPKWKLNKAKTELTYFVNESSMAMSFKRCRLTITDADIEFVSENVQPE